MNAQRNFFDRLGRMIEEELALASEDELGEIEEEATSEAALEFAATVVERSRVIRDPAVAHFQVPGLRIVARPR